MYSGHCPEGDARTGDTVQYRIIGSMSSEHPPVQFTRYPRGFKFRFRFTKSSATRAPGLEIPDHVPGKYNLGVAALLMPPWGYGGYSSSGWGRTVLMCALGELDRPISFATLDHSFSLPDHSQHHLASLMSP